MTNNTKQEVEIPIQVENKLEVRNVKDDISLSNNDKLEVNEDKLKDEILNLLSKRKLN